MVGQLQPVRSRGDGAPGVLGSQRPLDDQRARSSAMSSQVMAGLNSAPMPSMVTTSCPAKLAKPIAGLASIRAQYPGLAAMPASVFAVSAGGMTRPLRRSRVRWPVTKQSTVTTRTLYLAAAARSTSSLVSPLSRKMYNWNHRSGRAAPATASMVVVAVVDSVYGRPCRCAARAAAISPAGCTIRVYPVGARASGSGTTEPRNAAEVSACDTFTSVRGRNCHRRNALAFARTDSSSSAPPSTKSKTGRGVSLRAVAHRSAMSWQAESRLRVASSSAGLIWISLRISDALMSRTIATAARRANGHLSYIG